VPADELAAALGVSPERLPVRLTSLVSLGYVDRQVERTGQPGGYLLTERGWAELRRRLPATEE
jgi:DNA-binding HxlR family transcriptional regulator